MRIVKADWDAAILVCGKCSRRMGGGFGAKERNSLAKALRKLGTGKKGRKAGFGIVETGCLKLCPKNAAVAINGAAPHEWHIIARGTDPADAARELGLSIESPDKSFPFIP
jgi:predicted metal-binding protein